MSPVGRQVPLAVSVNAALPVQLLEVKKSQWPEQVAVGAPQPHAPQPRVSWSVPTVLGTVYPAGQLVVPPW